MPNEDVMACLARSRHDTLTTSDQIAEAVHDALFPGGAEDWTGARDVIERSRHDRNLSDETFADMVTGTLPPTPAAKKSASAQARAEKAAAKKAQESDATQGEAKPAEDKPAEDKPAEDKPAEDKPAEDKPAETLADKQQSAEAAAWQGKHEAETKAQDDGAAREQAAAKDFLASKDSKKADTFKATTAAPEKPRFVDETC